jgi:hypothetical protein
MNQLGFPNNNFFQGDVFIDGDTDIDGNLTVSGTYPGGGGGGGNVNNPMTEDLNANNNKITNLSEITGFEGVLKTSLIDVQNNDIYHVNELRGRSDDNKLYISGNVEMTEDLNMTNKSINDVNALTMSNGLIFNNDEPLGTTGQALILGAGGVVAYSDVLANPLTADLSANGFNIVNIESVSATYVDTNNINPITGTTINVLANLDLNSNGLTRVDRITCRTTASPSADLKLDLVPATVGTANQVLARDPAFNPAGSGNTKTVWLDAVLNPMTDNLNVNGYSLTNVLGIGATNGGVANINLNGDIKSTVGNYISGITNLIGYSGTINIQGDVKITDSLDLSTKNINRVEVLDTNYIESKINSIVRFNSETHMLNNLVVFGDIVLDYKTIFNVERITASHASVMLNLDMIPATQGTANQVLARDPAFNPANPATHKLVWQTVSGGGGVQNPMTANLDGGNFTITNLSSLTSTELKTTSIALSSGTIIQTSPLAVNTQLKVNTINPLTNPTILMPSVDFSGTLKTNNIQNYTGSSINITTTDVNISNKLNVLTNRSSSIGVRTTLFKTFGPMPSVNINSLTPVKLNSIIANQKGDNFIPPGAFTNGDKFVIIMNGLLTSVQSGTLNVYLYIGSVQAVAFNVINVISSGQPCKMTIEVDCTVSGNNVDLSNGTALLSMERFNTAIRFSTTTASAIVNNNGLSNSIDIYVSQSIAQVSSFTPLSYTIEQL